MKLTMIIILNMGYADLLEGIVLHVRLDPELFRVLDARNKNLFALLRRQVLRLVLLRFL